MELFHKMISGFLGIPERQISSTLHLLGEGATIPFISRYRKEATGGLDEVQIEQIKEQHDKLCDIVKRKETILGTINEQGIVSFRLAMSHNLSCCSLICSICTSSSPPVASLRYRLMKGIVAPSPKRWSVLLICLSGMPRNPEIIL